MQYDLFKEKVKKAVIVVRPDSPAALSLGKEVAHWLKERKITAYSHPQRPLGKGIQRLKPAQVKSLQLAIVLGGDGTYLEAVRLLKDSQIPILGVNMGSLGFLTVTRTEEIYQALELTLHGKMQTRPRALLSMKIRRAGKVREEMTALNDIVIERGPWSQLINLSIYVDGQLTSPMKADGLIIATPTGSTAYNLAAGGPILHPEVKAFVVTPICPHSLTNRPLIFPDHDELVFRLNERQQRAMVTIDGRKACEVQSADEIVVRRASHDHMILRKPTDNYFSLLREKLKFGARA